MHGIMNEQQVKMATLFLGNKADLHQTERELKDQGLVQWAGVDFGNRIWENYEILQQKFPNLNLEEKVVFGGKGIVRTSKPFKVCHCRKRKNNHYSSCCITAC